MLVEDESELALRRRKIARPGLLHEADNQIIERGQHLGRTAPAHLAGIFSQCDVAPMMQAVLNTPFAPNDPEQALRRCHTRRQTRDAIPHVDAGLPVFQHPAFQTKDLVQIRPIDVLMQHPAHCEVAFFKPPMPFVKLRGSGEVAAWQW